MTVTSNTPGVYNDASGGVTTPIALNSTAVTATLTVLTAQCVLDLDGNGSINMATDGLMLLRAMAGLPGATVIAGGVGASAARTTWDAIRPYINPTFYDLDGNGVVDPATDGLMLLRMMLGLSGNAVIANAIGANPTRGTYAAIRSYVNTQCGTSFN